VPTRLTPREQAAILEAAEEIATHKYGRLEVVWKNGRVLHIRPTKDIMLAESPKTEER